MFKVVRYEIKAFPNIKEHETVVNVFHQLTLYILW